MTSQTRALLLLVFSASIATLVVPLFEPRPSIARLEREGEEEEDDGGARKRSFAAEYWAWRRASLVDENGEIPDGALMAAHEHIKAMAADPNVPQIAGISNGSWTSIGPGNIGGRVRTIAIHPTSPLTMFVGSVSGGIWRTDNGGASWAPVQDFMANLAVTTIVFKPGDPSVMYAATGEGFFNADGIRGAGVFKSTNGGVTWVQLPATSSAPSAGTSADDYYWVNRLAVAPNGTTLVAATANGFFRSVDEGVSFTDVTPAGLGGQRAADLDFHPTNPLLGVASGYSGRTFYTTDGGATWQAAAGIPTGQGFPGGRVELAYAASNPSSVYALLDQSSGQLYKSTDGGQNYALVGPAAVLGGQGWYDNALWVNPLDENMVIVGGIDLYRSTTGGTMGFTQISQWFSAPLSAHADHHMIVAHPNFDNAANKVVFFGNDGGIYRANDVSTVTLTSGWQELNNQLAITQFYGGSGNPPTGRVVGGTQDNGHLFYNPSLAQPAEGWVDTFGGDGGYTAFDPVNSNLQYGEYVYLQIHRSLSGTSSSYIASAGNQNGLFDSGQSSRAAFIAPFILDPNVPQRMIAGGVSVWRAQNVSSGTPAFEEIKQELGTGNANIISALAVAPGNSDIIYAGDRSGRVYKTVNGTAVPAASVVWTPVDDNSTVNPFPSRQIQRIAIDPRDNDIVYVALGGFNTNNIWRSANGGTNWEPIATGLPAAPVRDIKPHPTQATWLYAATEVGVFASENSGATWQVPHDGPANVSVDELFFLGTDLYAATHGRGMFRTATAASVPTALNDSYATPVNTPLTVAAPGVLANDNSNGGGAMTASLETGPASGTLVLNSNGGFTYTPSSGFSGAVTFTYRVSNTVGAGNVATVTITVSTGPVPTAANDAYSTPFATTLVVAAPGVLANDNSNGGGAMTASLVTAPASGTLSFNADGGFTFVPAAAGQVSFTYRASNASGPGNVAMVTITVAAPTIALPPTGLYADLIAGNIVRLRWTAPVGGLPPTGFLLAGGLNPGEALQEIPTGSAQPSFTLTAPSGAFFVRIHTLAGASRSVASNEIRIFVNAPAVPSPPSGLLGMVNGSTVSLAWKNTFGGGTPANIILDVNGALVASLSLGAAESFSFAGVPPGTYTLSLRAINGVGSSGNSNAITLTFPGSCSGVPQPPANMLAVKTGNLIDVFWDPPVAGSAPTGYVLNVAGSFVGSFAIPGRTLSGVVGPGSYTLNVAATNPCGQGLPSPAQTVVIP